MNQCPTFLFRRILFCAAVLVPLLVSGCSPDKVVEAGLVLEDLGKGTGPSRLKGTTPPPTRVSVRFAVADRPYSGDLYRPGPKTARGAILLVPGAAEAGKDDLRLVAFAETLVRARFNVLVPDLRNLRELRTTPENVGQIRDLFWWLTSDEGPGPPGGAGIVAFSYAAGPAILAALSPAIRNRVDFILAVGPYFDLPETLTFFTTGYFPTPAGWQYRPPNAYGKWVFVRSNLHRLKNIRDRILFRAMAERKKRKIDADLEDLAVGLSEEGQTLYRFVTNSDPSRSPRLLRSLPKKIRADIRALDLASKDLSSLRARLFLVHGRNDPIIPYTQSVRLAKALPGGRTRLVLLEGMAHVDIRFTIGDYLNLWRMIYLLLEERNEMNSKGREQRSGTEG